MVRAKCLYFDILVLADVFNAFFEIFGLDGFTVGFKNSV